MRCLFCRDEIEMSRTVLAESKPTGEHQRAIHVECAGDLVDTNKELKRKDTELATATTRIAELEGEVEQHEMLRSTHVEDIEALRTQVAEQAAEIGEWKTRYAKRSARAAVMMTAVSWISKAGFQKQAKRFLEMADNAERMSSASDLVRVTLNDSKAAGADWESIATGLADELEILVGDDLPPALTAYRKAIDEGRE